jgi:hypothetical protein
MAAPSLNLFLLSCFTTFALLCLTTTAFTTTPTITEPTKPGPPLTKLIPATVSGPYRLMLLKDHIPLASLLEKLKKRAPLRKSRVRKVYLFPGTGTDDVQSGVIAETKAAGKGCEASGCTFDKKVARKKYMNFEALMKQQHHRLRRRVFNPDLVGKLLDLMK